MTDSCSVTACYLGLIHYRNDRCFFSQSKLRISVIGRWDRSIPTVFNEKEKKRRDSRWFSYTLTNTITSKVHYTPYSWIYFVVLEASNLFFRAELKLKDDQQRAADQLPLLRLSDQWASAVQDQTQNMAASIEDDFESNNQDYYSLLNVRKEVRFVGCCAVTLWMYC